MKTAWLGRQCAICKRRSGALTGLRAALLNLGIVGGYAHHKCYAKAQLHSASYRALLAKLREGV